MSVGAIITLCVIVCAIILFATELLSIDLVALSVMLVLILTGVISPQEGVNGFSNKATMTVAFMFVLSAALLKTGALQVMAHRLSSIFRHRFNMGIVLMMILIAGISAFINPNGRVLKSLNTRESGNIELNFPYFYKSTLFSNYGNKIFFLIVLLYIFLTLIFKKLKI